MLAESKHKILVFQEAATDFLLQVLHSQQGYLSIVMSVPSIHFSGQSPDAIDRDARILQVYAPYLYREPRKAFC